jgi:hypothetical protein
MSQKVASRFSALAILTIAPALFHAGLSAQVPQANAVPFVASTPTVPHTSWSGNPVILKGTLTSSAFPAHTFTYDWNPGDGGAHCTGTVSNQYDVECAHTYAGAVGTVFNAILIITDTTNSLVSPPSNCPPAITQGACYYTSLNAPPPNLPVEVNNAIDNGLWYLHTHMNHSTSSFGAPIGNWTGGIAGNADTNGSGDNGPNALDCTAFEVSGFLATNIPANPYSADVTLCLNGVFDIMTTRAMAAVTPSGFATFTPDINGNGIGVEHNGGDANYQTGMLMDTIAAAGTPNALVPAGTNLGSMVTGLGTGPAGAYTFKDAVFDGVDDYSFCANPGESGFSAAGGWHYTCQETGGDNSVSQWAAIGIIPARRNFGSDPLNAEVLATDQAWLTSSFTQASPNNGYFGYTSNSPLWGPYAVTPSGLVQLAMDGDGRGTTVSGTNLWDSAETFIRDNFGNPASDGGAGSLKDYYYGMFSFTKSMLLHDQSQTGLVPTPLTTLQSLDDPGTCAAPGVPVTAPGSGTGPCYPAIDWYEAQSAAFGGTDPTDGVARTVVGDQLSPGLPGGGSWFGQNYVNNQNYFQTAVAIIMLNKTVFQPVPVACFTVNPNHVASGGPVTLDGNCSVDQNPANHLVTWQWDISGTGAGFTVGPGDPRCLTASCSKIIANFTLPQGASLPYNYPVRLKVTDSANLSATVTGTVVISSPPNPPNANAGGPYNFCPNTNQVGALIYAPFILDGSHSTNPDQGLTDGTITAYDWDYSCSGTFTSAHGSQVDATTAFDVPADFGTSFNVCLRVTNNDNLAFPTAGLPAGLSSVASAGVTIHNKNDEVCSHCVSAAQPVGKGATPGVPASVSFYWTDTNTSPQFTIDHYNVYRSTSPTFIPNIQVAGASAPDGKLGIPVSNPPGGKVVLVDTYQLVAGTTYYYRVAPATANDSETCQGAISTVQVKIPTSGR